MENPKSRELSEALNVLYGEIPWPGVSCASYFWPYTQRAAKFEARRAVANLTYGLRYSLGASVFAENDQVSATDVLAFVKAANQIYKAADMVLHEVVAEAVARGATWTQIGEALDVKKAAAHKRFSGGLPGQTMAELKHEALGCLTLYGYWKGEGSIDDLGIEPPDGEAVTVETAFDYAFRNTIKSILLYVDWIRNDARSNEELYRVYDRIRTCLHIFLLPESLKVANDYSECALWIDANASTYFVHAASQLASAFNHFTELWNEFDADDGEAANLRMVQIYHNLNSAIVDLSRPECVRMLARIEKAIVDSGNAIYVEKREEKDNVRQGELFDAVWRMDRAKISEMLGIDEMPDWHSLDELLDP